MAYKRPKNLRDLLVHTRPPRPAHDKNTANGTHQCGSARCKTCAMVQDLQEIQFADQPGHREVIRGKFTCASTNVVYLLTCTACQAAYVGETGCTLWERMNGHRSAIKNGEDTPVANHFKEKPSVRVSVLTSTPAEVIQRRLMERAWIGEGSPWTLINRDAGIDVEPLDYFVTPFFVTLCDFFVSCTHSHTIHAFRNLLYTPPTLFTHLIHHSQLPWHQSHIHSHFNLKTLHLLDCINKTHSLSCCLFFLMKLELSETSQLSTIL